MIPRYTLPAMAAVWSERRKLDRWQEIEALALEGWQALGVAPPGASAAVRKAPSMSAAMWKEREAETRHDVAAFVDVLAASMDTHGEWLHYGLTSSDLLDTATATAISEAGAIVGGRLQELFATVRDLAMEHRETVMVARTHGMWAEPTTFGFKLAGWAFEAHRNHRRLMSAVTGAAVGKVSGAVGNYAQVPPSVEEHVCRALGITAEPAATQVVARDRHAELLAVLAIVGAMVERFSVELRHLQRSEVAEVYEGFAAAQKGSSAMPHKRNPIAAETITGLARLLRAYAGAGFENVALWHERDISHSSVERVVLPDAFALSDYTLARMTDLLANLAVDGERMAANLESTGRLVYSQPVLLALIRAGVSRDAAYRVVQRNAMRARQGDGDFRDLLATDVDVPLDAAELDVCFDQDSHLADSAIVFNRLAELS